MAYSTGPYRTIQDMSRIIDNNEILSTLSRIGYRGALAIEREAGSTRMQDILNTVGALQQFSV